MMKILRNGEVVDASPEDEQQRGVDLQTWADRVNSEATLAYRDKRKAAYIPRLSGGRPSPEEAIGDTLDAIITQIVALCDALGVPLTDEMSDIVTTVAEVKAAHPKPLRPVP